IENLSQRDLDFPIFSNWKLILSLIAGTIGLGIISGLYPSVYLSSFKPVKVLKGSAQTGRGKSVLRNVLVVTQFASAIFLIIATTFAIRQLNFMKNRATGFDREQVVNVPLNQGARNYQLLKKELLQNTLVSSVTASQDILGSHLDQSGVQFIGDGPRRDLTSTRLIVDPDYVRLYKIQLIGGRDFSTDSTMKGREYIINESLAKELLKDNTKAEYSSLLGKNFGFD